MSKPPQWFLVVLQQPCGKGKPWLHRTHVIISADSDRSARVRALRKHGECTLWASLRLSQRNSLSIKGGSVVAHED